MVVYKLFNLVSKDKDEALSWFKKTLSVLDFKYEYVFTIKRFRKKRSLQANALYWVLITAIADELGDDKKSIHKAYKKHFLPWKEIGLPGGLSYWVEGSTPDADSKEFSEYIEKIYQHAAQFLGIVLPKPDDIRFSQLRDKYEKYSQL